LREDETNTKLYIPSNVRTRFEFIRGFGFKELTQTAIVLAILLAIAFIIYGFTNNLVFPVLVVLIGTATMVIITAKDTNNLSVLDMINNMLLFANSQKNYEYKYYDTWRN